jgi:acyl-coenzyme A thioesterase PaaI-like protein
MDLRTHLAIDPTLVGTAQVVAEGRARAVLRTTPPMAADDRGLVHGGFVFGVADLAAMAAVNDPNVVLGAADVQLVAPVRVGDEVVAEAYVRETSGRKREVAVTVTVGETTVLTASMLAFVLDRHVLDGR